MLNLSNFRFETCLLVFVDVHFLVDFPHGQSFLGGLLPTGCVLSDLAQFVKLALDFEHFVFVVGHFFLEAAHCVEQLEVLLLLRYELLNDVVVGEQVRRVSACESILQALQGGVQFASSSPGMLHLLKVEVLYLLYPSLVILPFLNLVCALESLNLCNCLVSVFIDFVD